MNIILSILILSIALLLAALIYLAISIYNDYRNYDYYEMSDCCHDGFYRRVENGQKKDYHCCNCKKKCQVIIKKDYKDKKG
jgi:hypothetical protein